MTISSGCMRSLSRGRRVIFQTARMHLSAITLPESPDYCALAKHTVNTNRYLTRFTAALTLLLATSTSLATDTVVTPAMVRHWEGNARIIVSWCKQTNLPISLGIHSDGSVTGIIGDAVLSQGRLQRNRGWLGRKLHLKTDYIIIGDLAGSIVAAEGITRSGVKMPLNFSGGTFVGGLHTSGSKFGGKDRMILSASLTLTNKMPNQNEQPKLKD